ncbi:MAG: hypothetical protein E7G41_06420 [Bifidobacterium sp.]|nr:hypothetical protein [Bifidobacterium sp.]
MPTDVTVTMDELIDVIARTLVDAEAPPEVAQVLATNCASCERHSPACRPSGIQHPR